MESTSDPSCRTVSVDGLALGGAATAAWAAHGSAGPAVVPVAAGRPVAAASLLAAVEGAAVVVVAAGDPPPPPSPTTTMTTSRPTAIVASAATTLGRRSSDGRRSPGSGSDSGSVAVAPRRGSSTTATTSAPNPISMPMTLAALSARSSDASLISTTSRIQPTRALTATATTGFHVRGSFGGQAMPA